MAYVYRVRTPSVGEVMDPRDWNENLAHLAGELNGYLDRDNIQPSAVRTGASTDHVVAGAFNAIFGSATAVAYSFDQRVVGFRPTNQAGAYLHRDTFTTTAEGVAIGCWSGCWAWSMPPNSLDNMALRLLIDGKEICRYPRSGAYRLKDATMLMGAIPLTPGTHEQVLECKFWRKGTSPSPVAIGEPVFAARESIIRVRYR